MIGSQETSRQTNGRHSATAMARGRQQAERQGPDPEALKLEVLRGQLLEGWPRSRAFALV